MKTTKKYAISKGWLFVCLVYMACQPNQGKPDINHLPEKLNWFRFDQVLHSKDTPALIMNLRQFCKEHPVFCDLYFKQILLLPYSLDSLPDASKGEFFQILWDPVLQKAMQTAESTLPDEAELKTQLAKSTQYFQFYFKELQVPTFYTLYSGFTYANFIFEEHPGQEALGISLEFFAGPEFQYKMVDPENPVFSDYLTRTFNADHILTKTWDAWLEDKIPVNPGEQLLDYIIQRGKKMYILEHLLPEISDTARFEFTPKQLDWCKKNKVEIWSYFLSQKLLYSSEMIRISKYINPSPNAPGMPTEAPGRTGVYIGYELVKSYMQNHPEQSLSSLLEPMDSQEFLKQARFKPRNE